MGVSLFWHSLRWMWPPFPICTLQSSSCLETRSQLSISIKLTYFLPIIQYKTPRQTSIPPPRSSTTGKGNYFPKGKKLRVHLLGRAWLLGAIGIVVFTQAVMIIFISAWISQTGRHAVTSSGRTLKLHLMPVYPLLCWLIIIDNFISVRSTRHKIRILWTKPK